MSFMKKQSILFALLSSCAFGQGTWTKLATEGKTLATAPSVTLKAGQVYRFGVGTQWCTVTPKVDTVVSVWYASIGCDPAPGLPKELDVLTTVPPPSAPPVTLNTWTCTGTLTYSLLSDGTFSLGNTGALNCKVTP